MSFRDWRWDIFQRCDRAPITLSCDGAIADTLFFSRPEFPYYDPQGKIDEALSVYWSMLNRVAGQFSEAELEVLSDAPWESKYCSMTCADIVADLYDFYRGDDWSDSALKAKGLLPKIASLSDAEVLGLLAIISLIQNTDSNEPIHTLGLKLDFRTA